jgi:hypothetical protein
VKTERLFDLLGGSWLDAAGASIQSPAQGAREHGQQQQVLFGLRVSVGRATKLRRRVQVC